MIHWVDSLIAICQPAHSTHHTEHIVVGGIHTHLRAGGHAHGVVGHGQQQCGVINTGQVACPRGLVLLRGQGKGIHVDTHGGHVGVVLVGLHLVEIASLADGEAVVAVQLDQGSHHGVLASHALYASQGVSRLGHGPVPPIGVVERLLALPGVHHVVIARHIGIALHHPHQLLTGVVEVQLQLVGGGVDGLSPSELQHLNQVLVRHLGELATLISVQVDVIHIQRAGHQVGGIHAVADHVHVVGAVGGGIVPQQVLDVVELQIDTHLVVLEGDQRQSQTRVAAEPELQRDVEGVLGGTGQQVAGHVGLTAGTVVVARLTSLDDQVGQLGHVTHHLGVAGLLARLLGQLIPDVQPVTVVLVDTLSANLELHPVNQVVPHPVQPAERGTRAVSGLEGHGGQGGLNIHAVDQVTIALNGAGHLVAETGVAVPGVLNGLHGEVSMTTVNKLEKGNLGISSQVNILCAISHQLH